MSKDNIPPVPKVQKNIPGYIKYPAVIVAIVLTGWGTVTGIKASIDLQNNQNTMVQRLKDSVPTDEEKEIERSNLQTFLDTWDILPKATVTLLDRLSVESETLEALKEEVTTGELAGMYPIKTYYIYVEFARALSPNEKLILQKAFYSYSTNQKVLRFYTQVDLSSDDKRKKNEFLTKGFELGDKNVDPLNLNPLGVKVLYNLAGKKITPQSK